MHHAGKAILNATVRMAKRSTSGGKAKPPAATPSAKRNTNRSRPARPETPDVKASRGRRIHLTDVTLRDGHQSLLATRMRTEDLIPAAEQLDKVGFWSLEVCWEARRLTPVCGS